MAATWDDIVNRLGRTQMDHIEAMADQAPPLPPEALDTLTAVFAGAGERIATRRTGQVAA